MLHWWKFAIRNTSGAAAVMLFSFLWVTLPEGWPWSSFHKSKFIISFLEIHEYFCMTECQQRLLGKFLDLYWHGGSSYLYYYNFMNSCKKIFFQFLKRQSVWHGTCKKGPTKTLRRQLGNPWHFLGNAVASNLIIMICTAPLHSGALLRGKVARSHFHQKRVEAKRS